MDEIIRQIKNQTEINFINIQDQIEAADLEGIFDGVNISKIKLKNILNTLNQMNFFKSPKVVNIRDSN